jgi:hypothetical protein
MTQALPDRDERTIAVEHAGYRWAYLFVSFGILLIVAVRSSMNREASWDLLTLVILGGGVQIIFRAFHGALGKSLALKFAVTFVAALLLAVVLVLMRR